MVIRTICALKKHYLKNKVLYILRAYMKAIANMQIDCTVQDYKLSRSCELSIVTYACIEEDAIFRYHSLSPSRIPPFSNFHTLSNTMRYYLPEDNRTFVIKYSHLPSSSPSPLDFVHKNCVWQYILRDHFV